MAGLKERLLRDMGEEMLGDVVEGLLASEEEKMQLLGMVLYEELEEVVG